MKRTKGAFTYIRLGKGILSSNTYILLADGNNCAIIDPGNNTQSIVEKVNKHNLKVKYIILTHAHYDHIYYLDELKEIYKDAIVVCHEKESDSFANPYKNGSILFGAAKTFNSPDKTVKDNDVLPLDKEEITFIHTPGHTEGGVCIIADKFIFTGDTLFYRSYGRTDLSGGSDYEMAQSLKRLSELDPSLVVLPGHGTFSTIGDEKINNPFIGGAM